MRLKLTYEDYLGIPDDGRRHEIIDGDEYVTPSPRTRHQSISTNLTLLLGNYARSAKAGRVFAAPMDLVLSDIDVVQPDLIFVTNARSSIITEANLRGIPDLVVEILSEGTRRNDEVVKKQRYEELGVPEYWIVDPEQQTITVLRLRGTTYQQLSELRSEAGDILRSPSLPRFEASLTDVFAL
jgi:Uma2 family endonuclease